MNMYPRVMWEPMRSSCGESMVMSTAPITDIKIFNPNSLKIRNKAMAQMNIDNTRNMLLSGNTSWLQLSAPRLLAMRSGTKTCGIAPV